VSEPHAAPAEIAGQEQRSNLVARIAAALVLAPVAIAAAYGGGWWWAVLVTLACIGLFVEWLTVVGGAQRSGVIVAGVAALALSGMGLALDRIDTALMVLAVGLVGVAAMAGGLRLWAAAGFLYAAVAELASILVRLDPFGGV
jgi:phosphatidate cytidylyltransferase